MSEAAREGRMCSKEGGEGYGGRETWPSYIINV